MNKKLIINVVSGKGGTGKTLLSAVLAETLGNSGINTLVVDLDVFVRGLTALLYFHKKETLKLTPSEHFSVSDLFSEKIETYSTSNHRKLGISRYRSFDVLPAVKRIDENLSLKDLMPDSKDEAISIIKNLLKSIPDAYDVIILDSRAGYDELIAATHSLSDISLCVEEEDNISKITSDILISQLSADSDTPLFRLTNKARKIKKVEDFKNYSVSINDLGKIPFDMDVMNNFGADRFWEEISYSMYKEGLISIWNRLSVKLELNMKLESSRVSPFGSNNFEKRIGILNLRDRVLLVYGMIISVSGFAYAFMGQELLYIIDRDPIKLASLVMGFLGLVMSVFVMLKLGKK